MPYTRGTLYWQLNQWWPVSDWSTVEHHGRWKPAHYALRRIFAPLTASLSPAGQGTKRFFRVVWDLPLRLEAKVRVSIHALCDGREVASFGAMAKFAGAGVKTMRISDFTSDSKARGGLAANECFAVMDVRGKAANGREYTFSDAVFADAFKNCDLPDPCLNVEAVKALRDGAFEISMSVKAPSFFTWLEVAGDALGRFDDNLVALLPGRHTFNYVPCCEMTPDELRRRLSLSHL
jgi:beta-mannosidase